MASTHSIPRAALKETPALLALAVPVAGTLLLMGGQGTIETLMVGRLGPLPLAAMSLTYSGLMIAYCIIYGLLYPQSVLIGKAFGAGDAAGVAKQFREGLRLAAITGTAVALAMAALWWLLPFLGQPPEVLAIMKPFWMLTASSLLPFALMCVLRNLMEAVERQRLSLLMGAVMLGIAVPSYWLLILGVGDFKGYGLTGCGLAIVAVHWLTILFMVAVFKRDAGLAPYLSVPAGPRDAATLRAQLREGAPVSLQYCLEGGAVSMTGIIVGLMGALPLAANQVAANLSQSVYMLPLGLATALSIRIAQAEGSGRAQAIRAIAHSAFLLATLWGVFLSLLAVLFGEPLARLFTDSDAVIALAVPAILVLAVMQIADGIQSAALGALRGLLDNHWPTRVSIICYWFVALPASWGLGIWLGYGITGAWIGFTIGLTLAAVWLMLRFEKLCARAAAEAA